MTDNEAKWGTIEEKDANGNILSVKEGLVIGTNKSKRVISPQDVEILAQTFATYKDMAEYFGVKENTFRDHFRESVTKGRANTKMSLRQWQLAAAKSGNVTMLIWLGKNILGQTDAPVNAENAQILPWVNDAAE
jgi:hypothetical protein